MIKKLFLGIIKIYQRFFSPLLGSHCRFYPTCSEYCYQSVQKFGIIQGGFYSLLRLLKCNPFHPGGIDPVR